ncbi:MAG: hypothetical protein IIC83_08550 [Chloroflexi bacterium]|nr:hypothetical protein [Chloroflexota bacterium]
MVFRNRFVVTVAVAVIAAVGAIAGGVLLSNNRAEADANDGGVSSVGVHRMTDASVIDATSSTLARTKNGITATLQTQELEAGDAYTLWWVIFNHPENCEHPIPGITSCGEGDVFAQPLGDTDVKVSVQYAGGNIVGGTGRADFGAYLQEGVTPDAPGQLVFGSGLIDSKKAEVHLVVRSHGKVFPPMEGAQLSTFGGACTAETDPTGAGPEGPRECADVQFAAHIP